MYIILRRAGTHPKKNLKYAMPWMLATSFHHNAWMIKPGLNNPLTSSLKTEALAITPKSRALCT